MANLRRRTTTVHACRGITITETLICTAMACLIGAIAVPNYFRARQVADVAEAKSGLKAIRTALEAYKVDKGAYPWMNTQATAISQPPTLERLTTPIAYLTGSTPLTDPYEADGIYSGKFLDVLSAPANPAQANTFYYTARNLQDSSVWNQTAEWNTDPSWYLLESAGPDKKHYRLNAFLNEMPDDHGFNRNTTSNLIYDATNGLVSTGSIWQTGGTPAGQGAVMAHTVNAASPAQVREWSHYR